MTENSSLYLPVPTTGRMSSFGERNNYVVRYLENKLPPSDLKAIVHELKGSYVLEKYKTHSKRGKPKKSKFLTARKRTLLGLNKLKRNTNLKYVDVLALNELWLDYMRQMLGVDDFKSLPRQPVEPNWDAVGQQILKADFHGAKITVVKSKCPSLIGIDGIILQDTKCTFRVLGKDNIVRTIPKETAVFKIHLGDMNLQLFGKELCVRPAERSVKKFKTSHMADL